MPWDEMKSSFPPMWTGKEKETVDGTVVSVDESQFKDKMQYVLRMTYAQKLTIYDQVTKMPTTNPQMMIEGTAISMPNHAMLSNMLKNVAVGGRVLVESLGEDATTKKPGQNAMVRYKVSVWHD